MSFQLPFTLVDRSDVKVTRPALQRAKYRCQRCDNDDELRVVRLRGNVVLVLCGMCRVKSSQPATFNSMALRSRLPAGAAVPSFPEHARRGAPADDDSGIFKRR